MPQKLQIQRMPPLEMKLDGEPKFGVTGFKFYHKRMSKDQPCDASILTKKKGEIAQEVIESLIERQEAETGQPFHPDHPKGVCAGLRALWLLHDRVTARNCPVVMLFSNPDDTEEFWQAISGAARSVKHHKARKAA